MFERLSHPGHITVAKNSKAALEKFTLMLIAAGILIREECHDSLRNGQAASHGEILPDGVLQFAQ